MPRLPSPAFAPDCAIDFDGEQVPARAGESVAAALLSVGRVVLARSYKYHRPRGPFCLAGTCGNCLVRADGLPSQLACRTPCRSGLRVETQNAVPNAEHDLLRAVDFLTPRGLDHHHLMTWSRLANRAALAISRRLAGLGRLPDRIPTPPSARCAVEAFDALVVGGGPAGLGAAEALARAGRRVLLAERDAALGGRLRCRLDLAGDPPLAWGSQVSAEVARSGGEVALRTAVLGLWRDGGRPLAGLLDAMPSPRLRLVRARRIILCPGGTAHPPLFANNDLPGIFAGRGLAMALAEEGTVPGRRVLVLGAGAEATALAARLAEPGADTTFVGGVAAALGGSRLRAVALDTGGRRRCDALAVVAPPVPASELARECGAPVGFDPALGAFAVRAARDGSTGVEGVFAAGEATGALGAADAAEAGRRAGEAALG